MIIGIDHIVILVRDLGAAMDDYGRLGFTVELGGEHPGGTHNALIAFADGAYIELIAFKEPDQPHEHPWYDALTHGEGLVAFALGSDNLLADAVLLRERGLSVEGPGEGSRLRPDGQRLEWRNASVGPGKRGRELPFLIEDVTPRPWRVGGGWRARHAASVVSIVDVTLATPVLSALTADLTALLDGQTPSVVEDESGRRSVFATPRGNIIALEPATDSDLAAMTTTRGTHLAAATLGVRLQGGEPVFDTDRLHGAHMTLRPV